MAALAYRTNVVRLDPTPAQQADLQDLARRVSALWNVANYECRQAFFAKKGVPGYTKLCAALVSHPVYRSLPSDIAQEVLKKLTESWRSYFELRRLWAAGELPDKPGLPDYRKDRRSGEYCEDLIPIKHPRSYTVDSRSVSVALPHDLRARPGGHGGRIALCYRGLRRYRGKAGRAELCFDRGMGRWYFRWSVSVPAPAMRARERAAGIDLGVRVLASVSVEGEPLAAHYSGREVLKDWDYWGRRIAGHQRELAHRGRKRSRRLARLHKRRRARLVHAWEAMAARVAGELKRHGVGVVFVGHPKEIRRERSYGGVWNGRIHNFWSFDLALRILEKHLVRAGIEFVRANERGTSSSCPGCRSENVRRAPRTWLTCKDCGLRIHSDQAGSRNMIHQNRPGTSWDGLEASPRTETRSWDRHGWVDSGNQRRQKAALPRVA